LGQEIVRQRVPGHWTDNRKCLTSELAEMMMWKHELVVAGTVKMLTAGDIESSYTQS